MAAVPPPRPGFVLDEERKKGQSAAAAIPAIVDDDDNEDARLASSTRSDPKARQDAAVKPTTFWTRLQAGWEEVEDRLAEWFGLDQSKYQWAVDELLERQLAGDQPTPKANMDGLQMQNIQEQSMQRDVSGSNF